ncbi:MAG: efflux RND transporter periplasmic adaptor subunit [Saprospiraceae bacterium]|nr:efflux RND transporter periplasmic adaptor subunit [Saprospiraceae bacterium]
MKKNWKFVRTGGWLIALLFVISACQNNDTDHSQHDGTATAWQCPMKCEGDKTYHEPGNCPVCKMDLKPVEMPDGHDHSTMKHEDSTAVYTCPMHPEIVRNEPGSCPICKMDLVKKETTGMSGDTVSSELDMLLKPTYEYVLSSVKTVHPERKTITASMEAPGYLAYDARKIQSISARFGGRIERLYVKYPYQPVKKGQRILDLYSPEIATAQQDLIFLLENDAANTTLIENARRRLSLLGLTAAQIGEVEKTKKPSLSLSIFSPYDGLVFEKPMPTPALPGEGMEGDGGTAIPTSNATAGELSLREGMYVQKGQRLFSLQNLATVWAVLEFYPSDASAVKVGQTASIRIEPFDKPFSGKINYVEPQFGAGGKNMRARVYLANPGGKLKPGALLNATVQAGGRSGLWIPRTAALDLGRQKVVFLKKDGVFKTQKIEVGGISGDWLEVRSGISETDEVAADAQFLMDSESFVKSN